MPFAQVSPANKVPPFKIDSGRDFDRRPIATETNEGWCDRLERLSADSIDYAHAFGISASGPADPHVGSIIDDPAGCNAALAAPKSCGIFWTGGAMDSMVSVRFFTVVPSEAGQASFESCLKKLMALSPNPSRPVDDVTIQAANTQESGDRISGDLVRVQDQNLPSLVPKAGKHPEKLVLNSGAGLGHHTAFLYDKSISVLAYQITRNYVRNYNAINSDRASERTQLRGGTTLTQNERRLCGYRIADRDGGYFCFYCKDPLGGDFHIDHKIPIAKGGTHNLDNMVLACMPCNQEKHAKDIDEYRAWRRSRRLSVAF